MAKAQEGDGISVHDTRPIWVVLSCHWPPSLTWLFLWRGLH